MYILSLIVYFKIILGHASLESTGIDIFPLYLFCNPPVLTGTRNVLCIFPAYECTQANRMAVGSIGLFYWNTVLSYANVESLE